MKKPFVLLLTFLPFCGVFSQNPSASSILDRSIRYHDPDNKWPMFSAEMTFDEKRPNSSTRNTSIQIDNSRGFFKMNRNDTEIHGMVLDSCFSSKGIMDCKQVKTLRNYYLYLWGLPMKLKDRGTNLPDEANDVIWIDYPAWEVRVKYPDDQWSFYFDKKDFKLIGYQFYKNDGTGEKIVLVGEKVVDGMKIPKERSWYTLPDEKYLGTDILKSATEL